MGNVELERFHYHITTDTKRSSPIEVADFVHGTDTMHGFADLPVFKAPDACARFFLLRMINEYGEKDLKYALHQPSPTTPVRGIQHLDKGTLVRFGQSFRGIPVFGAEATVELDDSNRLISVRWSLGSVDPGVNTEADLSIIDAKRRLADAVRENLDLKEIDEPQLQLFGSRHESWRLVWHFFDVPASPYASDGSGQVDPESGIPVADFLIDAHNGHIAFSYGKALSTGFSHAELTGLCEHDQSRSITGSHTGDRYRLHDIARSLRTRDAHFNPVGRWTGYMVTSQTTDLGDAHRAAVSAHYNATLVGDFYREYGFGHILPADLIGVINCCDPHSYSEVWRNAYWANGAAWYGQVYSQSGRLVSTARFLDVVAHEITHGIIDATSGLINSGDGAALHESFADIFGVIIKNYYKDEIHPDVTNWDWTIGEGFPEEGGCLRDLSHPERLNHPNHLKRRLLYPSNPNKEAHENGCIPSKALHIVLTSSTPKIAIDDWISIIAKAMGMLHSTDTFNDMPVLLKSAAFTHLGISQPNLVNDLELTIDGAYQAVGIHGFVVRQAQSRTVLKSS
ncbi:M4 family metallopeptidase [Streptomyces sp. NPDC057301]|uniref:M4 family metallopeptidase n=1 Tax=Streptomyces sp. NPDC057301 TaxID=3346093 RepID=UPI00363B6B77